MNNMIDDYYYRLGRHQAVIEMNREISRTRPSGLTKQQMREWNIGYEEMSISRRWNRAPVLQSIKENVS